MSRTTEYVLGSADAEIARLDGQANAIAGATDALLRAAGLRGAMRVLELGTGLGHVAFQVAALIEEGGSVLAIDEAEPLLEIAERRRAAAGTENVEFRRADARTFTDDAPFDAIVERLLLFHLPDREEVLRRQMDALRPGGMMVMVEFDVGAVRCEPSIALAESVGAWIEAGFRSAGADPRIGARAGEMLRRAGFAEVTTFGIQPYAGPGDPAGPRLFGSVGRALAPQIIAKGIADEAELGLDTLQERVAEELRVHDAVMLLPTVVGAWGRRPLDS